MGINLRRERENRDFWHFFLNFQEDHPKNLSGLT